MESNFHMDSAINKEGFIVIMDGEQGTPEVRAAAAIVVALVEIREAVEEGFGRIDQTNIEAALMLVGCKETLDAFLDARLKADKVLSGVVSVMKTTKAKPEAPIKAAAEVALAVVKAANESKEPETAAKSAEPGFPRLDKPEKPAVTLDIENFDRPDDGSGKT